MTDIHREPTFDKPVPGVQFDMDEFEDRLTDGLGKEHDATIKWEGYFYEGSLRIVKLEVTTKYDDYFLQEIVIECIEFRTNKRVTLETKMELL